MPVKKTATKKSTVKKATKKTAVVKKAAPKAVKKAKLTVRRVSEPETVSTVVVAPFVDSSGVVTVRQVRDDVIN